MPVAVTNEIIEKAEKWLNEPFDDTTRTHVQHLMDNDEQELIECFYKDLEFGTGGLRGIMGVGSNRMNIYTVGIATQGLANYVKNVATDNLKAAIAYDSRNNSPLFAQRAATILAANGFTVYLFESLRPTPELSFAIRHLECHTGIVITASHNPKEYNGFKAYWSDGGQLIAPHDKNVITEVRKIGFNDVLTDASNGNIINTGEDVDNVYLNHVKQLSFQKYAEKGGNDLKVVYTPIHGTGVKSIPKAMELFGFNNVTVVEEQAEPDGNFSTVHSPNPEEAAALQLALDKAKAIDADIVLGTDPDADRVGIAVKDNTGDFVLLNGNQAASVLVYYLLEQWKSNNKLTGKEFVAKTIVTTELIATICAKYDVACINTLTGFKYIAELIKNNEGERTFIGGGEESYGYLVGDFVRDKDAVISAVMLTEIAAWAKDQGLSFYQILQNIYAEFGHYKEKLISITKKGKEGSELIAKMMENFRNNPPSSLGGLNIAMVKDYQLRISKNILTGEETNIDLPVSNVIQFYLEDGSLVTARPSGTEPKIKFYFSVKGAANDDLSIKIDQIVEDLGIDN